MNKPAAKEPSMDEILSSIRQIIADDDATAEPEPALPGSDDSDLPSFDAFLADEGVEETPEPEPESEPAFEIPAEFAAAPEPEESEEALALSLDQVVDEAGDDTSADEDFALPDDVAFVAADLPEPETESVLTPPKAEPQFGTMPDPSLSSDMADHLLDTATQDAARHAFSQLGGMAFAAGGQTVEGVVRELLRPMLKSWLDENLPSMVERLVQREIERVSRGGR